MSGVALGAAAIGVAGSVYGSSQAKKASKSAAAQSTQDQLALAEQQNTWNKENAIESIDLNRGITGENQDRLNQTLLANRPTQNSDFGSIGWQQGPNGEWTQTSSLAPETQAMLGTLRGKQGDMINGMESGFGVDNSVMDAMRGLQQPGLQQSRNAENARLAAMGLGTGSGSAWGIAQDTLNRADSTADLQAILAGNTAWNSSQANMRSNLSALNGTETGWHNNMTAMPGFNTAQTAQQNQVAPNGAPSLSNVATNAANAGNAAGQATGQSWANGSQGVGELVGSAWQSYMNQPQTLNGTPKTAGGSGGYG